MQLKIGHGYDVHAFADGDYLVLGGVNIPYEKSFAAHSDGDVLIHAICDAILGAVALGDIGQHFPDTNAQYARIDSRILLRDVVQKAKDLEYVVGNVDATVIAQAPKLSSFITAMRQNLAEDLAVTQGQVNVKATTTEHLGFTGRREGVSAHAVVILQRR